MFSIHANTNHFYIFYNNKIFEMKTWRRTGTDAPKTRLDRFGNKNTDPRSCFFPSGGTRLCRRQQRTSPVDVWRSPFVPFFFPVRKTRSSDVRRRGLFSDVCTAISAAVERGPEQRASPVHGNDLTNLSPAPPPRTNGHETVRARARFVCTPPVYV